MEAVGAGPPRLLRNEVGHHPASAAVCFPALTSGCWGRDGLHSPLPGLIWMELKDLSLEAG